MTLPRERAFTPTAALRPWVSEIRAFSWSSPPARVLTRLPSGGASLVLCTAHTPDGEVSAIGPNTRASYKLGQVVPLYTRVAFRPGGARAFFGVPLYELTDRVVSIDDLWGRRAAGLREELARAEGGLGGAVRTLEAALLERLDARRGDASRSGLLRRAVSAIEAGDAEPEQVPELARRLGVSERTLRQLFREQIGVSPKKYARIARIRRVVARAGSASFARLAAEGGFYDQAHMNAEFRDLLGVTPRAFLAGEVPLGAGC